MKTSWSLYLTAVTIFLLKTFAAIRKSDPNYSEEFHQVYDAKLSATVIIYCNMGFNQQSEEKLLLTMRPILSSFQKLKFFSINIFICDNIRKKLGAKLNFQTHTLRNESPISASDVLIVFGSPGKGSAELLNYGQSKGFNGKLSINCVLNMSPYGFSHSFSAPKFDIVLLFTQSEAHRYTRSWLATLDFKQQTQPPPTVIVTRKFSLPMYKKAAFSTQNNSVSLFIPNILSLSFNPQEEIAFIQKVVHGLNMRELSSKGRGSSTPQVKILWRAECRKIYDDISSDIYQIQQQKETQQIRIRNVLLALNASVISSNSQLTIKTIITFIPHHLSSSCHSLNDTYGGSTYKEVLESSSVLWVRLPALSVLSNPLTSTPSPGQKISIISNSTIFDYDDEWRSLIVIENLIAETQQFGCISFLVTNSYSAGEKISSLSSKTEDNCSDYDWLVNNIGSFAVKNINSLVSRISNQIFSVTPEIRQKLRKTAIKYVEEQFNQKRVVETIERMFIDGIIGSTFRHFVIENETMLTMKRISLLPITAASPPNLHQNIGMYMYK
jgi:hypothetical protein